jgi:predicted DNA-binding WGR domain protein
MAASPDFAALYPGYIDDFLYPEPMRIYMQIPPQGDKAPRFYHLHLQEDLLEGWTLIREWGYQGSAGRVKKEHFDEQDSAEAALLRARDEQLKRGYQVVFMQAQPL